MSLTVLDNASLIDCTGADPHETGLTDAHVHICAVEANVLEQYRLLPPSLLAARALRRAEECLLQGFTTVRDAGDAGTSASSRAPRTSKSS